MRRPIDFEAELYAQSLQKKLRSLEGKSDICQHRE